MFEAQLSHAGQLKKIIDAVKELIQEANFDCGEDAISLQAMDSSHVAIVSLKLNSDMFQRYRADQTAAIGLNLADVAKALKCANNEDVCILRFNDHDQDNVTFAFHDSARTKNQEWTLKLMNIGNDYLAIPNQQYAATIEMPSTDFAKVCRDFYQFTDAVTIAADGTGITFSGNGERGKGHVHFSSEAPADNIDSTIVLQINDNVSATFSLKYMLLFAKAAGLCDRVRLSIVPDLPICIEYKIEENGYLRYYLAPKIEDEMVY